MVNYLKRTFALSEQGAKDLVKAVWCCTLMDIGLMLPVGLSYFLLKEMLSPYMNGSKSSPSLLFYISASIVIVACLAVFEYMQYNTTFLASYKESANKRISLAERLRKLPLSFFAKKDLSDLTTTIMSDCAGLETAFSHYVPELIGAIISIIIVSIGLLFMDVRLTLSLIWVIPVAFFIGMIGKKKQYKANKINSDAALSRADKIQECLETVREIKSNNQVDEYGEVLDQSLIESERVSLRAELTTGIFVISAQMVLQLGIATTVLTGSFLLMNGSVDLLTFIMFLIAATRIFDPLSTALINLAAIFATLIKVERMNELEQHSLQTGKEEVQLTGHDLVFSHVEFSYDDGEQVLKDVSFVAKHGQVTALVGPSGGGKSTIAKLAARFYDINKGKITLGGKNIANIDPETLLSKYSIVFQDVVLFNNTVLENIRIGKKGATDEEVYRAAKAAHCDEFITKLSDGYQTMIGENGSMLSGGERQRISIARAILKDAPIILLDEATASLDVENETFVQKALSELIKNKTVLVIAHRMRTVAGADKIVVLKNGYVAEEGTPVALRKKNGIFAHMNALQTETAKWAI